MENRKDLRNAKILVIGGAGFVGGNLVRRALAQGNEVVVVDNLLSAERSNLPGGADHPPLAPPLKGGEKEGGRHLKAAEEREDPDHPPPTPPIRGGERGFKFIEGSIADNAVLARISDDFGYIFHLATYHGNQSSIANPLADHENNLITTLKLYEHIKGFKKLKKVVYAASGCTLAVHTYDQPEATREDGPVPLDLDSPYQISKVVGEFYSVYYNRQHGLPTVRARFQNVYGPGEILGAGKWRGTTATVWRNVTPTFIYRSLKHLPLRLDNEGLASRDFIYVDDIVQGLILCATVGEPGDVYNLASGVETTILELAKLINEMTGNPTPVELAPRRDWDHSGKRFGSTEKSKNMLGFRALTPLETGLSRTVEWARQNLHLIDESIRKHAAHLEDKDLAGLQSVGARGE